MRMPISVTVAFVLCALPATALARAICINDAGDAVPCVPGGNPCQKPLPNGALPQCGVIQGQSCGTCPNGFACVSNACVVCIPKTCHEFTGQCGTFSDGCNGLLNCGCHDEEVCTGQGQHGSNEFGPIGICTDPECDASNTPSLPASSGGTPTMSMTARVPDLFAGPLCLSLVPLQWPFTGDEVKAQFVGIAAYEETPTPICGLKSDSKTGLALNVEVCGLGASGGALQMVHGFEQHCPYCDDTVDPNENKCSDGYATKEVETELEGEGKVTGTWKWKASKALNPIVNKIPWKYLRDKVTPAIQCLDHFAEIEAKLGFGGQVSNMKTKVFPQSGDPKCHGSDEDCLTERQRYGIVGTGKILGRISTHALHGKLEAGGFGGGACDGLAAVGFILPSISIEAELEAVIGGGYEHKTRAGTCGAMDCTGGYVKGQINGHLSIEVGNPLSYWSVSFGARGQFSCFVDASWSNCAGVPSTVKGPSCKLGLNGLEQLVD